jgi:SAM-dependent methyltransferase
MFKGGEIILMKNFISLIKHAWSFNSQNYWNDRYNKGMNSGAGSYGRLAEFKANIINDFIKGNAIASVIELGCGDGNQLSLFKCPKYLGIDVSKKAVEMCMGKYERDCSKDFMLYDSKYFSNRQGFIKADLVLSLDVIYHLVEDDVYEEYMTLLFQLASRFVVIYSSNDEKLNDAKTPKHIKHRQFTQWADARKGISLVSHIPNKYPLISDSQSETFADFYIFSVD